MKGIVECVPNFSTSDPAIVNLILNEIRNAKNSYFLDHTYDNYYNRLVVTFVGDKNSVFSAALNSATAAIELIDMNEHKGQHPRIGAVDVVPFIPIRDVTIEDCVVLAKKFGEALAKRCNIPVYLYGKAASSPERSDLDWIRLGEYEKLHEKIEKKERKPDFGPSFPHPTAGATITGARKIMAGFNVNLGTPDIGIAKKIAKTLHSKKGGLPFVKAMAAKIPERNITQIGMSISDFEKMPLYRVLELIELEAEKHGIQVVGSEFCGLAPLRAIMGAAAYYLKIDEFNEERILEVAVQEAIKKGRR